MGVMGSHEFLLSRSTLSQNQLDLGKFYGFQHIHTKKKLTPKNVQLDLKIPKSGYLDIYFQDEQNNRLGLRIHSRENGSFSFTQDSNSFFSNKTPLPFKAPAHQWETLSLEIVEGAAHITFLDIQTTIVHPSFPLEKVNMGLGSGYNGAIVDNIKVRSVDGSLFEDYFRFTKSFFLVFFTMIFLFAVLIETLQYLLQRKFKIIKDYRLLILTQTTIVFILLYSFDFYIYSSRPSFHLTYYLNKKQPIEHSYFENFRYTLFSQIADFFILSNAPKKMLKFHNYPNDYIYQGPIICSTLKETCQFYENQDSVQSILKNSESCQKVVFLGTSQTVGSGASRLKDSFFAQTFNRLAAEKKADQCLTFLNMSVSGSGIKDLIDIYKAHYLEFKPNIMFVILGNNDELEPLKDYIAILNELNVLLGTKTVFFEEINSINYVHYDDYRQKMQQLIKHLATQQISTISRSDEFAEHERDEIAQLWWDYVHMTDAGQTIMADWLFIELKKLLNK
ncbi:MAG: SGNH/GDSL hydrolase family protein [Bdellovibrionales bacterium]|nr:SGNH/GDSL hydrolase family protein [Bdellovibrionales bacterium]